MPGLSRGRSPSVTSVTSTFPTSMFQKTTAANGTKATTRPSKVSPLPAGRGAVPSAPKTNRREAKSSAAESPAPKRRSQGVEARQRERVDEGEHHDRRDVARHPEPPSRTSAADS